jgi:hypothetical protein
VVAVLLIIQVQMDRVLEVGQILVAVARLQPVELVL